MKYGTTVLSKHYYHTQSFLPLLVVCSDTTVHLDLFLLLYYRYPQLMVGSLLLVLFNTFSKHFWENTNFDEALALL